MIVKKRIGKNVVEAARERIIKAFSLGRIVELGFSGGKDSIVLAHLIYDLIKRGKINKNLLEVTFIDEEAMYDEVIDIVKLWRRRFIEEGVKFNWYCLPVKHFNCLNSLSEDETFICWDPLKKDKWVREMPKWAITDDPFLIPYKDNYQAFLERRSTAKRYITMHGARVSESVQRQKYMAKAKTDNKSWPIYDFTDKDVWLYIKMYNLEYPKVYEHLYESGRSRKDLRISQFFSIDTAKSLVSMGEVYPDLMERITKREPNAYLCALYWDTEMFGRSTSTRRKLEKDEEKKDYKALVLDMIKNPENTKDPKLIHNFKNLILRTDYLIIDQDYKKIYECILRGDPKRRTFRAITTDIMSRRQTIRNDNQNFRRKNI